jgi:hypothetical protein
MKNILIHQIVAKKLKAFSNTTCRTCHPCIGCA